MASAVVSPYMPISALCSIPPRLRSGRNNGNRAAQVRAVGNFGHFVQVVRKDVEFVKKGISKGVEWANEALRIPQVYRTLDDFIWLRNLEDRNAPPFQLPSWPEPYYPADCRRDGPVDLVKISAACSEDGMKVDVMISDRTFSRMKWISTSMCFVLSWRIEFENGIMVDSLSQNSLDKFLTGSPDLVRKE